MMKHLVEKGADFSVNEVSPLKVLTKGAKVPLLHTGRDDLIVKVNLQSLISASFSH